MAKSKSGGTRAYIRGRVGADVYSIGRDAMGKKQQVVRSLAESVANPQTQAQMRGRMIMSTVMQALSALKPIVDHSFDNVSGKQPNISEFIARNYRLIKYDVAQHPAGNNDFGLNVYQERGAKQGRYVISDGEANIPAALVLTKSTGVIALTIPSDNLTIGGLKAALGFSEEEFFTLVGINTNGGADYERFRVNPAMGEDTAISAANLNEVFAVEGNKAAVLSIASNVISISMSSVANCCAVIVSKKTTNGYIHNKAILGQGDSFQYVANTALPTYPVGSQDFLNGGDLFGLSEVGADAVQDAGGSGSGEAVNAPEIGGENPFTDSTQVTITGPEGAALYYTTDGSTPDASKTAYTAAFTITDSTTVKAIAIKNGVSSSVTTRAFTKSSGGGGGGTPDFGG